MEEPQNFVTNSAEAERTDAVAVSHGEMQSADDGCVAPLGEGGNCQKVATCVADQVVTAATALNVESSSPAAGSHFSDLSFDEGVVPPTASDGNMKPPVTFPPVIEALPDGSRPRSPLRDGTALDGLVPNRPLLNSLLDRSDLRPVEPPLDPSTNYTRCRGFLRTLEKAKEAVGQCDTLELAAVARTGIAPLHQPKVKEISDRKLAYHIPDDPIDPVVVFVKAIPLVHRVLHQDASGKPGLDLDGVAYIVKRLGDAECLRVHQQDIRFDMLLMLAAFLVTVIEKAEEECWACLEAA